MKRVLILLSLLLIGTVFLSSQSEEDILNADEVIHSPPGEVEGYYWFSDVGVDDPGALTVLYDGAAEFPAPSADRCRIGCNAFPSCKSFLFLEPQQTGEAPRCRLLSRAPDTILTFSGSHLYLRD